MYSCVCILFQCVYAFRCFKHMICYCLTHHMSILSIKIRFNYASICWKILNLLIKIGTDKYEMHIGIKLEINMSIHNNLLPFNALYMYVCTQLPFDISILINVNCDALSVTFSTNSQIISNIANSYQSIIYLFVSFV